MTNKQTQVDLDVQEIEAALNLAGRHGDFHRRAAAEALRRLAAAAGSNYCHDGRFMFETK